MNNKKKEWTAVMSNKIDESQKHQAEQKLAGTKEYVFYNSINFKL